MEYKFVTNNEDQKKPKSVTVITPTIGSSKLIDAMQSVADQTYENIQHLVVIDGRRYQDEIDELNTRNSKLFDKIRVKLTLSPENTGANGFYGHRIYAAYPHLVNSDYIFFLDEDNWYKPNHVEALVATLEQGNEFAYSLREIYDENKNYICDDNCESLGKWPIWFTHDTDPQYLIDTSSFAFRRSFLIQTSQLWHSGWGGDRRYYSFIRQNVKHDTSSLHTLCYRLDGNPNSVKSDFFEQGNEDNYKRYNGKYPWIKGI